MIAKHKLLEDIIDVGVVAVVRVESTDKAERVVEACLKGGVQAVEITFTVPRACHIIEKIANSGTSCILGAGTVLDSETARAAILAGARYIVSPSFDEQTAKLCNRYAVPYMAGCYTPAEAIHAMEFGVDILKLFPSALLSPNAIKVFKAPLPQANFMPTGGVNLENVAEWIEAGAVALGIGGDLVAGAKRGNYNEITEKARLYRETVKKSRANRAS